MELKVVGKRKQSKTLMAPIWSSSTPTASRFSLFVLGERPVDQNVERLIEWLNETYLHRSS